MPMESAIPDGDGASEATEARPRGSATRRLLVRWFVEYNPLYLVSALLVLGGLMMISRGQADQGTMSPEVGAIPVIAEVYAAVLIAGAALLTRLGQRRPAVMLALITALYQCDLTLFTERSVYLGFAGALAALAWLIVFVVKLYALAWAMRVRLSRSAVAVAAFGALGLAVLPHGLSQGDPSRTSALIALWIFALFAAGLCRRVPRRELAPAQGHDLRGRQPAVPFGTRATRLSMRKIAIGPGAAAADGHRSHAFVGGRDEALVRSSILVNATRPSSTVVHIVLAPAAVGHCVPTGDLFRRLEVSAEALGADLSVVGDARVHLARRFRVVREGDAARKELASDDRVCDATRTVDVDLDLDLDLDLDPLARGRAIAWRVAYQRVESPGGDTDTAVVADEIEIEIEIEISAGVAPAALLQPPVE